MKKVVLIFLCLGLSISAFADQYIRQNILEFFKSESVFTFSEDGIVTWRTVNPIYQDGYKVAGTMSRSEDDKFYLVGKNGLKSEYTYLIDQEILAVLFPSGELQVYRRSDQSPVQHYSDLEGLPLTK